MGCKGCSKRQNNKLNTYDWLCDVPDAEGSTDFVEVQFKNTRKGYYLNSAKIPLEKGDIVAVEASPGHDIGTVSLTGKLVLLQMKKNNVRTEAEPKRIYRKAKPTDIEKYEEAKAKEHATMIRSRQIAADLGLNMKIGDVEYQGDGNKAIFYYIADERVDFRQLIKVLAEAFRVRIEMKQIGARQEAGRIGGLGACGRELCCASWMSSFSSVTTGAARVQDISLNPQKLAGQCSKLKCCMMYEYDTYVDARKEFPRLREPLQAAEGEWFCVKSDVLAGTMTFSSSKEAMANVTTLPVSRVREIMALNRQGKKVERLQDADDIRPEIEEPTYRSEEDSITRFDQAKRRKRGGRNNKGRGEQGRPAGQNGQTPQESGGETRQPREGQPGRPDRQPRRNDRPRNGGNGGERQNGGNGERPHNGNGRGDNNRGENNGREPRENNGREPRENNGGGREGGNRSRNNRNRRRGNGNNGGNAPAGNNGNGGGSEGGNNGGTHQNQ